MEVVTLEEYNRVQEIMASHAPKKRHPREVASRHLLSGLVYSDGCGSKMSPTGGERSYYNCNRRRNQVCPSCDTPNPKADHLDAAVIDHVFGKILTPENMQQVIDIVAKGETVTMQEVEEEVTDLQIEIEGQKNARKNLLTLVETNQAVQGDISERLTEIRKEIVDLEGKAQRARAKISNERSLTTSPKKAAAYAKSLQTYLRKDNIELTKEILNEVIVQVRIRPGEEKDTTTVIIRYRIPMPPREWNENADVEELLLRKNQRSLDYPVQAGGLSVTGFYATKYVVERAYGNYLGLCRLGKFMAQEMGLRFDQMVCIATPVKLERPKYSVKSLAESVGNALAIFEDAGSDG